MWMQTLELQAQPHDCMYAAVQKISRPSDQGQFLGCLLYGTSSLLESKNEAEQDLLQQWMPSHLHLGGR